jgi:hypothetical protein
VFDNRVLRRIFGQKKDEVSACWKMLHNGELHNLYCPTGIIKSDPVKEDEIDVACSTHGSWEEDEEECV